MKVPNNRNWKASEDRMPTVGQDGPTLRVTGEVETNNGRIVGALADTVPQGVNPAILMLDLSLVNAGETGTDDVKFRPTKKYEKKVKAGQHTTVQIMWDRKPIATIEVEIVH